MQINGKATERFTKFRFLGHEGIMGKDRQPKSI